MIIQNVNDPFSLAPGRLVVQTEFGRMEVGFGPDEVRRTAAILLEKGNQDDFASQAEVVAAGLRAEGTEATALT